MQAAPHLPLVPVPPLTVPPLTPSSHPVQIFAPIGAGFQIQGKYDTETLCGPFSFIWDLETAVAYTAGQYIKT